MNDWFKTNYCLDMHYYGEYPGYYMRYLKERDIVPVMEERRPGAVKERQDGFYCSELLPDTVCQLSACGDHKYPKGMRVYRGNEVDFDQYGYCRDEKNVNLKASEYGAQIDPMGLRIVLNDYYSRYHLPLIITENGLGTPYVLTEDGKVHDDYRIDYIRGHLEAMALAMEDGVELMGACLVCGGSFSSHQGFRKRYGFVDQSERYGLRI